MYAYLVTLTGSPGRTTVFQNVPPDTYSLHVTANRCGGGSTQLTAVKLAIVQSAQEPSGRPHPLEFHSGMSTICNKAKIDEIHTANGWPGRDIHLPKHHCAIYKPQTLRSATQIQSSRWSTTTTEEDCIIIASRVIISHQ